MKIYKGQIPFNSLTCDQLTYPENSYEGGVTRPPEWIDNYLFVDTLTYQSYCKGRSSIGFKFKRKRTGTLVTMFMTDFNDIVHLLSSGQIRGEWAFCKRGANYGCLRIGDDE